MQQFDSQIFDSHSLTVWLQSPSTLGVGPRASVTTANVKPLGSFESWTVVIGGILAHAGVPGFLSNLLKFYEQADIEGAAWRQFVDAWWERFGQGKVGVSELFDLASGQNSLDLGKGNERSQKIVFGRRIGGQRDRVVGEYRISEAGTYRGAGQWMLVPMTKSVSQLCVHTEHTNNSEENKADDNLSTYVEI